MLLPVDGDPTHVRWVLLLSTNPVGSEADPYGSSMHYVVGRFDGVTFTADAPELVRLDHGRDYYAGVTFDSAPAGEVITLGWMNNWRYAGAFPSQPWRGAMSLPRRLELRTIAGRSSLVQKPPPFVREHLARATPATIFGDAKPHDLTLSGHSFVDLQWNPASTGTLRLQLAGSTKASIVIEHDATTGFLHITRAGPATEAVHPDFPSTSTVPLSSTEPARLLLSLDGPLLEVFVNDGEATISNLVVLGTEFVIASLNTERHGPIQATASDVPAPEGSAASAHSALV